MNQVAGFILLKKSDCFIRWLIMGGKGNFNDFYESKNLSLVDPLIGFALFTVIMFFVVDVF
jgi:hypothetical protein